MATTPENNVAIIRKLNEFQDHSEPNRFVLIGSLARGVLSGLTVESLHDPSGLRYQDVDIIDRTVKLFKQYRFMNGKLDAQPTKSIHPLVDDPQTWGFYDSNLEPSASAEPISTFNETALGLKELHYSEQFPEETTTVPSPYAMLFFSNFFAFSHEMPKHRDQIETMKALSQGSEQPELQNAFEHYIDEMRSRYPQNKYSQIRRTIFKTSPKLAMKIQEANVGRFIRFIRNTAPPNDIYLAESELQEKSRSPE